MDSPSCVMPLTWVVQEVARSGLIGEYGLVVSDDNSIGVFSDRVAGDRGRWRSHLQLEASVDEALGDVGVAHEFKEALVDFLGGVHVGADDVGLLTGVGR